MAHNTFQDLSDEQCSWEFCGITDYYVQNIDDILNFDYILTNDKKSYDIRGNSENKRNTTENDIKSLLLKQIICAVCSTLFPSRYQITKHVFTHLPFVHQPVHICSHCGKLFLAESKRRTHVCESQISRRVIKAEDSQEHRCATCPERFLSRHSLIPHVFCHVEQISCPRNICGLLVKEDVPCSSEEARPVPRRRRYNWQAHHGCLDCGKKFCTSALLRKHYIVHDDKRPFVCDVCCQGFKQADHLQRHERVHTGERPYSCSICAKTFKHPHHVKYHQRIHSGKREFICNICGKDFIQPGHLRNHQRIHTGLKPHSCEVCGKAFGEAGTLRVHKRFVHTGERPFICKVCGRAFAIAHHLRRHEHRHAGNEKRSRGKRI